MKRQTNLPELLAPAGGPEALYAAIEAGADAVYFGGQAFSARASAENFDEHAIRDAVLYCHAHGKRIYAAVNTLLSDGEMDAFLSYCTFLYEVGVDALIVADYGAARLLRERLPEMELHASTQMSVHSTEGADALYRLGFARVVLARELSARDIAHTTLCAKPEIEIFLHGALCVCHSGQCLFSSLVGGRSGNRGECAQPCRLPYDGGYALSLKDLCLAAHVPSLIQSGVASLKIEGRMKQPSYVYEVTRIYRRLLDEGRAATEQEMKTLSRIFSRDGFTDGYYTGHTERGMLGIRRQQDKDNSKQAAERTFLPHTVPLQAEATVLLGEKVNFTLHFKGQTFSAQAEAPVLADQRALDAATVKERLCKMGGTPFSLCAEQVTLRMQEGVFLPLGVLGQIKREALASLFEALRRPLRNTVPLCDTVIEGTVPHAPSPRRTALFYHPSVLDALDTEDMDLTFLPLWRFEEGRKRPDGVALPPVIPDSEREAVRAMLQRASEQGIRYAMVSGLGGASLAAEFGFRLFGDFRLNIRNRPAAELWKNMGLCGFVLSPEIGLSAMRNIGMGSAVVLGRVPLMLTERCFMKDRGGCHACGKTVLTDRKGVTFPLLREYEHRNLILNSVPTFMGDKRTDLVQAGIGEHFIFTSENAQSAKELLAAYRAGKPPLAFRRIPK